MVIAQGRRHVPGYRVQPFARRNGLWPDVSSCARLGAKLMGRVSPSCSSTSDLDFPGNGLSVIRCALIPIRGESSFAVADLWRTIDDHAMRGRIFDLQTDHADAVCRSTRGACKGFATREKCGDFRDIRSRTDSVWSG